VTGAIAETERLVLREFVPGDVAWLAPMLGDPETLDHWERPLTVAESEAWIDRSLELYARDGYGLWAVELRGGGPLGDCGLWRRQIDGEWEVELGYHFARRHWGNGYATEAATACVEFAKSSGIDRLVALILPANVRSQGVARRVGLQPGRELIHAGRRHVLWETPPVVRS
jgi:ribosomal-protein-alanine N-acetyltransferase